MRAPRGEKMSFTTGNRSDRGEKKTFLRRVNGCKYFYYHIHSYSDNGHDGEKWRGGENDAGSKCV